MNKRMIGATFLFVACAAGGGWPFAGFAQPAETAAGRFVAEGAEVTDTLTGLVWRRCAEGQNWTGNTCADTATVFPWQGALDRARSVGAKGVPWRLPNAKELGSLVDYNRFDPAIDSAAFPGAPATPFWTSTREVEYATDAWVVDFRRGGVLVDASVNPRAVRLVRAGQ